MIKIFEDMESGRTEMSKHSKYINNICIAMRSMYNVHTLESYYRRTMDDLVLLQRMKNILTFYEVYISQSDHERNMKGTHSTS